MNRLHDATSPYLLQHADNPVDWYPWGEDALARARAENKPILLSIGYSACHWCHVMAHESFEDADIAALMNRLFINIKVDREERPDLDKIYQAAHQLLTQANGGWPLTMFLTPDDQMPYFGGTYFPNTPRHGRPGFADVLQRVAQAYRERGGEMADFKHNMRAALDAQLAGAEDESAGFEPALMARAVMQFRQSFDTRHGGFGGAPKFPHPEALALLLTDHAPLVEFSLRAMAAGGLMDHVGGGFYRYSTDAHWSIPHFEKMLYDNAALLGLYAQVGAQRGLDDVQAVACATAEWLISDMQDARGGFHSSIDADAAGEEGSYYVWTRDEVQSLLGADYAGFAEQYGLAGAANFEGRWHLRRPAPGSNQPLTPPSATTLAQLRKLHAARASRVAPARDDKILTSWNALTIRALASAGRLLSRTDFIAAAERAFDFIIQHHWRDGRLLATSRHGVASVPGYLDDHGFMLAATVELLNCRWRRGDLEFAVALADVLLTQFEDEQRGGFYFTARDHEALLVRVRSFSDDALPSGNVMSATALLELAHLVGDARYQRAAERALEAAMQAAHRAPPAHASALGANFRHASAPPHVLLRGDDHREMDQWRARLAQLAGSDITCYAIPSDEKALPGILDSRAAQAGATVTAYVCRGTHCSAPATSIDDFLRALK
ncbi:MAG: thioredoxin domain-containing protein [Gammaproteobacteria bacterium]|nr:thioredoxin domain-containing protein [Gammaproteobacteria bacterium]